MLSAKLKQLQSENSRLKTCRVGRTKSRQQGLPSDDAINGHGGLRPDVSCIRKTYRLVAHLGQRLVSIVELRATADRGIDRGLVNVNLVCRHGVDRKSWQREGSFGDKTQAPW